MLVNPTDNVKELFFPFFFLCTGVLCCSNRYNPVLEAVITITEDLAYKQAKQADQLLAQGVDLGIGIRGGRMGGLGQLRLACVSSIFLSIFKYLEIVSVFLL